MPSRRFRVRSLRLRPRSFRPELPRAARPPATLALVAGVVAAVIATGHPGAAADPAAPTSPTGAATEAHQAPQVDALVESAQVGRALGALAAPGDREPQRASRSHDRRPL